jgi:3-mercaptopyruvate sulfurtransferase SseA
MLFSRSYREHERPMNVRTAEHELAERTKRFVKAELKRADVTYEQLAHLLREMGYDETKVSVANKLSRGTFSATFFVAVMKAIGVEQVRLEDV